MHPIKGWKEAFYDILILGGGVAGLRAAAHFTMGGIPINERAEISLAALHREESRGAHYRADHSKEKPQWRKNLYVESKE